MLSVPVLVALGWAVAGLLWWDARSGVITPGQRPWTMAGFALLGLAMLLAMAGVPARPLEQAVRLVVLVEAGFGIAYLRRRGERRG